MSRLIVKNLPKNVTENKLKELFSEKGIVTDIQLKYTEDGKFRRFGFVGFKTEEQAAEALKYFNNTCINTSRITVEYCAGLGDESKPKSWSKYAPDSKVNQFKKLADSKSVQESEKKEKSKKDKVTAEKANTKEKEKSKKNEADKDKKHSKIKEILEKHKDDPLFNEFITSHTGGDKNIWSNDTLLSLTGNDEEGHDDSSAKENSKHDGSDNDEGSDEDAIAKKAISDKEYMEALKQKSKGVKNLEIKQVDKNHGSKKFFTVKVRGLAYHHKKKDIKIFFKGIKPKSIRVPPKIKGIAYVGFKTEKLMKLALNKNKSFLDGKRIFVTKYEETQKNEETRNENSKLRWKQQEEALKNEEDIAESGRIFLRNLAYTVTEDDIRKLFEKYGPLTEVNIPIDKDLRKPKGFGTVTFLMPEHAVKAYTELDGSIQNGRMLHLLPAKTKTSLEDLLLEDNLSYKQKKELLLKKNAGSSHNWNTLFLGQNAVAEATAKNFNTTKEKVLEDSDNGTSVAVRLALAETHLVQETQKFLEENGVCLNAFNQPSNKRSKTVILVKNLPAGTVVQEIRDLFVKFGELGRVVLPPSGITGLVEFIEPSEARKAFTRLAYSKFKHLPLYLEWAPDDTFTTSVPKIDKAQNEKNETKKTENEIEKNNINEKEVIKDENIKSEDEDEDDEPEPETTLFVKNLNFSTTEEQLRKHFSKCGRLHYATISMKKDPKNPGNKLSMGYGFVRYKLKSDTEKALKELQMSTLDGKTLELKRSERTLQSDIKTKKPVKVTEQTGVKILVRNVPFQAHADEIKDLFKVFGELKGVRLPKKLVGDEKHRGFAFVEFYTKKEAKRAFKALCQSTHLYGRRLVLEWAQTDENIEDLRKRTAKHFHQEETVKRSKKGTLNPESIGLEVE